MILGLLDGEGNGNGTHLARPFQADAGRMNAVGPGDFLNHRHFHGGYILAGFVPLRPGGGAQGTEADGADAMVQSEAQKRLLLEGGVQLHFHGRRHHLQMGQHRLKLAQGHIGNADGPDLFQHRLFPQALQPGLRPFSLGLPGKTGKKEKWLPQPIRIDKSVAGFLHK